MVLPFDLELATWSPESFIERVLRDGMGWRHLYMGFNSAFGKDAAGTAQYLAARPEIGVEIRSARPYLIDDQPVSSTGVRRAILKGELEVISTFVCKRPKNPTNPYPRGDIDNFEKALYDAITNSETVWVDDTQISLVNASKRYTIRREKPCIHVKVRPLNYE